MLRESRRPSTAHCKDFHLMKQRSAQCPAFPTQWFDVKSKAAHHMISVALLPALPSLNFCAMFQHHLPVPFPMPFPVPFHAFSNAFSNPFSVPVHAFSRAFSSALLILRGPASSFDLPASALPVAKCVAKFSIAGGTIDGRNTQTLVPSVTPAPPKLNVVERMGMIQASGRNKSNPHQLT